jgi:hypothetical protein
MAADVDYGRIFRTGQRKSGGQRALGKAGWHPTAPATVNLTMRYMAWSCALYRAGQEHGMTQARGRGTRRDDHVGRISTRADLCLPIIRPG